MPENLDGKRVGEPRFIKIHFMEPSDQRGTGILQKKDEGQLGKHSERFEILIQFSEKNTAR